ncbi:MAG: hypothetical protein D3905_16335, partial [Candidatus Electrothrix sp. AS4_5]|nr:hypothetical protein [Candidatus Electrothrix gigas]
MKIRFLSIAALLLCLFAGFGEPVQGKERTVEKLGAEVVKAAFAELKASKGKAADLACLTNAGYVRYQGESTRILYDVLQKRGKISLGNITVELFLDTNGDGVADTPGSPTASTTTNASGEYSFIDVTPG